jgi:hypothetical protein
MRSLQLLTLALLGIVLACPALSDPLYTYQYTAAADYTSCYGGYAGSGGPGNCNQTYFVTGSITLSSPLKPDMPNGWVPFVSLMLTDNSGLVLKSTDPELFRAGLALGTNSYGEIDQWNMFIIDYYPATSEVTLISTYFDPIGLIIYEDATIVDAGSPSGITGAISSGEVLSTEPGSIDPGHWIPEPSTLLLLATGAGIALRVSRSRRRA